MNNKEEIIKLIRLAKMVFISKESSRQDLLDIIESQLGFWDELDELISQKNNNTEEVRELRKKVDSGEVDLTKYEDMAEEFNNKIKNPESRREEWGLEYCKKCNQMTNHLEAICLKCRAKYLREKNENT